LNIEVLGEFWFNNKGGVMNFSGLLMKMMNELVNFFGFVMNVMGW
jgi:hypothetical protein